MDTLFTTGENHRAMLLKFPLLVISDSHGCLSRGLGELLDREQARTLVHLGDLVDRTREADKNDFHWLMRLLRERPDVHLLLIRGGHHDVYGPLEMFIHRRQSSRSMITCREGDFYFCHDVNRRRPNARIVVCGHSHEQLITGPDLDYRPQRTVLRGRCRLNPGSFERGSYCLVTEENGQYVVYPRTLPEQDSL